jgi:hypothetical protein
MGQAPSRPLIFQGFRRFRSEPVPFFHSLSACCQAAELPNLRGRRENIQTIIVNGTRLIYRGLR